MLIVLVSSLISVSSVSIIEPIDGETYNGDWLPFRVIVENENVIPDSVNYSLNGAPVVQIPRLNTDWYTYMANDHRTGYSEAPAPHDNTILWTRQITGNEHEFVSPVVVDGRVFYSSEMDEITYCLDAATGEEIWRFENIGDAIDDAVHVVNGRVYLASDSIWCLDAYTGSKYWSFGNEAGYGFNGPPVPYGSNVFVAAEGFYVFALDIATGEEIWRTTDPMQTNSSMTAWNDILFVPETMNPGSALQALYAASGEILWSFQPQSYFGFWDSSPCIVDSILYIGACGNETMYAIDPLSGSVVWEQPLGYIESTPACDGERVIFGTGDSHIYSLNPLTGEMEWVFLIPDGDYLHGSPGIADGLVFWGDLSYDSQAYIHAVDITTGQEIWNYQTDGGPLGIQSSPSITDGVMYIAATDSLLYAFGTGLKYTYREDYFYADLGSNELIVTSFDGGVSVAADTINFTVTQTGITLEPSRRLALFTSPNPFSSAASISFELSEPGWTSVALYDLNGRIVRTLEDSELVTGQHSIVWNGTGENGEPVSAGLYLCRIESSGVVETTGLCLLR